MGWSGSYEWTKKSDAVRDTLKDFNPPSGECRVIASKSVRRGLWMVVERAEAVEIGGKPVKSMIILALMAKHGGHWMVKLIDECMGPVECDCPMNFLAMVPDPGYAYSTSFRERVRAYHGEAEAPPCTLCGEPGCGGACWAQDDAGQAGPEGYRHDNPRFPM